MFRGEGRNTVCHLSRVCRNTALTSHELECALLLSVYENLRCASEYRYRYPTHAFMRRHVVDFRILRDIMVLMMASLVINSYSFFGFWRLFSGGIILGSPMNNPPSHCPHNPRYIPFGHSL